MKPSLFVNPDQPPAQPDPHRRGIVVGVAAALAAAAGIGLALRHQGDTPLMSPERVQELWDMQWQTPQGATLPMRAFKGRPLLINFWATWCPPCIEELPLINAFYRQNAKAGWQVLGLAADKLAPVQAFLGKFPLDFPVGIAGMTGIELSRSLGNLAGGLPFSVVMGADGDVAHRKLGQLTGQDLNQWLGLK
jgi:thiol-disulfide isomerase/thioredoxin